MSNLQMTAHEQRRLLARINASHDIFLTACRAAGQDDRHSTGTSGGTHTHGQKSNQLAQQIAYNRQKG